MNRPDIEAIEARAKAEAFHLGSSSDVLALVTYARALESERGHRGANPDGTDRLVRALHDRDALPRDYLGGPQARMLHEGADRIAALSARVAELEAMLDGALRDGPPAGDT